jgi:hypothetical protein
MELPRACSCRWPGVVKAADEFAKGNSLTLNKGESKWWVYKPLETHPAVAQQPAAGRAQQSTGI